jgi:hypothetical protein
MTRDLHTLQDAGVLIRDREPAHSYRSEISDHALAQARRRTALRDTPQSIRSLPMRPLHEATSRASCLPSVIVGALLLGLAFLEGAVPAVVGMIR